MAPSGLAFYQGQELAAWDGHLFAGALLLEQQHRLELDGNGAVTHEEVLLDGVVGRIRDVRSGPNDMLLSLPTKAMAVSRETLFIPARCGRLNAILVPVSALRLPHGALTPAQ